MRSPKPYSRREMRLEFRAWARRNWRVFAVMAGIAAALLVIQILLLMLTAQSLVYVFFIAAVVGGVIVSFGWMIVVVFLANSTKAIYNLRGAWGEDLTRDELKRARRKDLIWGWVDSIELERSDIDHFVVTRRGGIVVVDSKFRTVLDEGGRQQIMQSAQRLRRRGAGLARTVLEQSYGRRRGKSDLSVEIVVAVWGPEGKKLEVDYWVDDVHVIGGHRLLDWLRTFEGDAIEKDVAEDLLDRVHQWSRNQRRHVALSA